MNNSTYFEPNTLVIHFDENSFRTIEIELTPEYTCEQFLNEYAHDLDSYCLVETWKGYERKLNKQEKFYDLLKHWDIHSKEIKFYLKHNSTLNNNSSLSNITESNENISIKILNMEANNQNNTLNQQSSSPTQQKIVDLTLYELQEIAMKQQQQIEINQQLLLAKEKRLRQLKQDNHPNAHHQQQQQQLRNNNQSSTNCIDNTSLTQEYKLLKLKQLRNQIVEQKISNSNMYSEIDLIKSVFASKERELYDAIAKVSELTKQIEQLKFIKQQNKSVTHLNDMNSNELDKLKQELHIRNKLNEQQVKKIMQQQELFQQKQHEVNALDRRIEELQKRIANKRASSIQLSYNNTCNTNSLPRHSKINSDAREHKSLTSIYQQQSSPSNMLFEDDLDGCNRNSVRISNNKTHDSNVIVCSNNSGGSPVSFESLISPSPSKVIPKFASKQEIAHTYMNKYGSEAYQKYQEASKRLTQHQSALQPQQPQQQQQSLTQLNIQTPNTNQPQQHLKQISIDSNDSLSSNSASSPSTLQIQSLSSNGQPQDTSSLPSHLKCEFDKIKFIPDMVKTIKKRHSISEIEGSMHTVAPQVFQKMLEQHHKNSQLTSLNIINENESSSSLNQQSPPLKATNETMKTSDTVKSEEKSNKKTKSIIKMPSLAKLPHGRRVNFDPHALLLDAAVEGELELVKKCAKHVKSISEPNDEGITALHNSVCAGHFDIVKFLVEYGCDINYADNDGWTPLHCAASCNNLQMVKFLIEHGAAVFATTISDNETAIDKCEEDEEGYQGCFEYLKSIEDRMGVGSNEQVFALYDYEPENDDELGFKCADQLVILDKNVEQNDGWWSAKLINNAEGQVPRNYLGVSLKHNYLLV